jgi:hypothetical protein
VKTIIESVDLGHQIGNTVVLAGKQYAVRGVNIAQEADLSPPPADPSKCQPAVPSLVPLFAAEEGRALPLVLAPAVRTRTSRIRSLAVGQVQDLKDMEGSICATCRLKSRE